MVSNLSVLFFIKKQKDFNDIEATIYLRITLDGRRAELSTSRKCQIAKWDAKRGKVIGNNEEAKVFNNFLISLKTKVYDIYRKLFDNGEFFTIEDLRDKFLGKKGNCITLIPIFREHNDKIAALVGKDYARGTLVKFETSLKHIKDFMLWKYKINDIDVRKINLQFINDYDFYLRTVRRCQNNSTVKCIKNFGKIIRLCQSNGWITKDPFVGYRGKVKNIDRVFLSEMEIDQLMKKDFVSDRLTQVRDVFIFCCYTGLAYIDVKNLKTENISIGLDNEKWIFTNRGKTGVRCAIPLLPIAKSLIDKYATWPSGNKQGYLLPVFSNQKMNDYLKEIASICGIHKQLTSHIARHTFATTITLTNGVPIESVSKMLGHSSLRSTQHYAKILDVKISNDMHRLRDVLNQNNSSPLIK